MGSITSPHRYYNASTFCAVLQPPSGVGLEGGLPSGVDEGGRPLELRALGSGVRTPLTAAPACVPVQVRARVGATCDRRRVLSRLARARFGVHWLIPKTKHHIYIYIYIYIYIFIYIIPNMVMSAV